MVEVLKALQMDGPSDCHIGRMQKHTIAIHGIGTFHGNSSVSCLVQVFAEDLHLDGIEQLYLKDAWYYFVGNALLPKD